MCILCLCDNSMESHGCIYVYLLRGKTYMFQIIPIVLLQEAFHSVEDIYGLMCMVKKTPKPSLLVVYYAKMTEIFWISSSHLYHAYAWLKLFTLQKTYNKNLNQKDLQLIANSVLLAALLVLPYDHSCGASRVQLENEKDKNLKMASLIGFNVDPKPENKKVVT